MDGVEREKSLPLGILLAVASQETDMHDVVGDGGHGRGLFQIDDRSHQDFLRRVGAIGAGRKPPIPQAADHAGSLLASNISFGASKGVASAGRLKFGLSAYNAGAGGALKGLQEHGDPDFRTTGGDYGKSVLARFAMFQSILGTAPRPVLKRGKRGRRVTDLKVQLKAWFDKHAPGVWATFGVNPGPFFGVKLETAVKDFQRRNHLDDDGKAGKDTFDALARG
jgi:peptidoglycan hydrolase-like protein with peptidoglycan-binding domain